MREFKEYLLTVRGGQCVAIVQGSNAVYINANRDQPHPQFGRLGITYRGVDRGFGFSLNRVAGGVWEAEPNPYFFRARHTASRLDAAISNAIIDRVRAAVAEFERAKPSAFTEAEQIRLSNCIDYARERAAERRKDAENAAKEADSYDAEAVRLAAQLESLTQPK